MSRRRTALEVAVFVGLPLAFEAMLLASAWHHGNFGVDFEQTLLPAARKVAAGRSPYPAYGYPPLVAFALAPLSWVPYPAVVFSILLAACVPASLRFLGVRDWRCYGVAFLWGPVFSAIQTENVTLPLLLGISICWWGRDRLRVAATGGGLAIAAKILCWPVALWLLATRRVGTAIGSAVVAGGVTLGLWATIGFSGLVDYPKNLNSLGEQVAAQSYTVKALLLDAGAGTSLARTADVAVALAIVAGVIWLGLHGDDRRSFTLAVAAMIAASPIVWLHSFSLLLAPIALARPRLSPVWLLPVLLIAASGTGNGTPWQTALVLGVAAIVVGVALGVSGERSEARGRFRRLVTTF